MHTKNHHQLSRYARHDKALIIKELSGFLAALEMHPDITNVWREVSAISSAARNPDNSLIISALSCRPQGDT